MKLRSFFYGLTAVVLVLLLLSAGSIYWILAQSPLNLLASGATTMPSAAIFVPRQAPAMVSLLVNPDRLEGVRQAIAAPGDRKRARAELAQFRQSFLANTGLEYTRDVQPWLGEEVTLAITTLDIDRDLTNGKQPGYLLAIATKAPEQSRQFLQLFWQKRAIAGADLTFEQYKGVKLIYEQETPDVATPTNTHNSKFLSVRGLRGENTLPASVPATVASAVVGDQFVLFANHPKVLRDAITNVQAADLNLESAPFYRRSLATLTAPRIGLSFVNLPGLATWLETSSAVPSPPAQGEPANKKSAVPAASTSSMLSPGNASPVQTLALALELDRQGLLAETALSSTKGSTASTIPSLTQPVAALQYLPATIPFSASGSDLDRLWTQLSARLQGYEKVSQLVTQPVQDLQNRWNVDFAEDLLSWVTGDYALGWLPAQSVPARPVPKTNGKRKAPALSPSSDWIFIAQRTGATSQSAIAHLDDLARQQGYSVGALTLGDQPVSAWTSLSTGTVSASKTLQANVEGVHATVGNYEIFATSVSAMEMALAAVEKSLASSDRFQTAIAPLQRPNSGYLYLDWRSGRPLLERQFPILNVLELAGKPLFSHLESLTLSSYGTQSGVQRAGLFIHLN